MNGELGAAIAVCADTRSQLDRALAALRPDDSLVVWKLDRRGRSGPPGTGRDAALRGVALRSLTEHSETATAAGKML